MKTGIAAAVVGLGPILKQTVIWVIPHMTGIHPPEHPSDTCVALDDRLWSSLGPRIVSGFIHRLLIEPQNFCGTFPFLTRSTIISDQCGQHFDNRQPPTIPLVITGVIVS